jgi:uncharacterized protein (TIGR03435 family)
LVFVCSLSADAQDRPALDVVSIREDTRVWGTFVPKEFQFQPGRLVVVHLTLEELVLRAYAVPIMLAEHLVVGWPKTGIKDKRFDVTATMTNAGGPISSEDQRRLVLEVLTTRFGLKAHTERTLVDGYRLTVVTNRTLGPGLRRVDFDCTALAEGQSPKDKDNRPLCGYGELRARGVMFYRGSGEIARLVNQLNIRTNIGAVKRPIVDATGLRGLFMW